MVGEGGGGGLAPCRINTLLQSGHTRYSKELSTTAAKSLKRIKKNCLGSVSTHPVHSKLHSGRKLTSRRFSQLVEQPAFGLVVGSSNLSPRHSWDSTEFCSSTVFLFFFNWNCNFSLSHLLTRLKGQKSVHSHGHVECCKPAGKNTNKRVAFLTSNSKNTEIAL